MFERGRRSGRRPRVGGLVSKILARLKSGRRDGVAPALFHERHRIRLTLAGLRSKFSVSLPARERGDVTSEERSEASSDPPHPNTPSSVGPALSWLASTTKGCSDASGCHGSAGSIPERLRFRRNTVVILCALLEDDCLRSPRVRIVPDSGPNELQPIRRHFDHHEVSRERRPEELHGG